MTWVNDHGIQRWVGEFPEPSDAALEPYVVHYRSVCGDKRGTAAGAKKHYRKGETPCMACAEGKHREQKQARDKAKDNICVDCRALIKRVSTRCNPCAAIQRNSRRTA